MAPAGSINRTPTDVKKGQERFYRKLVRSADLDTFEVRVEETDMLISVTGVMELREKLRREAREQVERCREEIKAYAIRDGRFMTALEPIAVSEDAGRVVRAMAEAGRLANVGPMAAVAGALAEEVGNHLLNFVPEVIIENGGDIFMSSRLPRVVGLYAGGSPLSGRIGLVVGGGSRPVGLCTSSGTVGHSLSFGKADAATILARSASVADAVATLVGNAVKAPDDIEKAMALGESVPGVLGVIVVVGVRMGVKGQLELVPVDMGN